MIFLSTNIKKPELSKRYFWFFIAVYFLIWTLGPAFTRNTLPHDTLEGITWGFQWQWGYSKHPFLAAWLCAGMTQLFGSMDDCIYFLAQLLIATTWIAVWQLARKILPPTHAMLASLALAGVLFYNINAFNITPDTLQSPLWALLTLFFYEALTTQRLRYWLLTGSLAGLCILTKYQVFVLFLPMLLFCLMNAQARISFKKPGIYLGVLLMSCLALPHFIWLYHHHFISLFYGLQIGAEYTEQASHLIAPIVFIGTCALYTCGLFALFWPFYRTQKNDFSVSIFEQQFLYYLGLGPFLITVLLCVISGEHYPARWATPYFSLLGVLILAWLRPKIAPHHIKQFMCTLMLLSSALWVVRIGMIQFFPRIASDAYLPNKTIAHTLMKIWQENYHTPLPYLAGSHYLVAALVPYIKDKPIPFLSWSQAESPWIDEAELKRQGGLFIWDAGQNYVWDKSSKDSTMLPDTFRQAYPNLRLLGSYIFYRTLQTKVPVVIGVAILPPESEHNLRSPKKPVRTE